MDQNCKRDKGKPEPTLVDWALIEGVARVRRFGIDKYQSKESWREIEIERFYNALLRHIYASWNGEKNDPESGLSHLAHAGCNLMFLLQLEEEENARSEEPFKPFNEPKD